MAIPQVPGGLLAPGLPMQVWGCPPPALLEPANCRRSKEGTMLFFKEREFRLLCCASCAKQAYSCRMRDSSPAAEVSSRSFVESPVCSAWQLTQCRTIAIDRRGKRCKKVTHRGLVTTALPLLAAAPASGATSFDTLKSDTCMHGHPGVFRHALLWHAPCGSPIAAQSLPPNLLNLS